MSDDVSWTDLTAFQRDLLEAVARVEESGDVPKGVRIMDEIQVDYEVNINHGRTYPNLDELAELGLIEKGEIDNRTNSYGLTEEAWELLESRRDDLARVTGTPIAATDGGENWDPEPAELRDDEDPDESSHAGEIVEKQIEKAREEGDLPDGFDDRASVRSVRLIAVAFAAALLILGLLVATGGGL